MEFENKLLLYAGSFMVFYWAMQFTMLFVFGAGYCSHKTFLGCILPIVYFVPLGITLVIFIPIWRKFIK